MKLLSLTLLLLFPPAAQAAAEGAARGFSVSALDRSAKPCEDFYQFACGGWLAKNPVPPDESRWGRFNEVAERNKAVLRDILEKAAAEPDSPEERKLGDFYASCMDEEAADRLGTGPVKEDLERIEAIGGARDVSAEIARLFASGVRSFFRFGSTQDYKDASSVIAALGQSGLGLPDRDYYLMTDPASAELREKYARHVKNVFVLAGYSEDAAEAASETVLRFETELAEMSMDKVERRDPEKTYHKMTLKELAALAPDMDWRALFKGSGAPKIKHINVSAPDFIRRASALIATAPASDWKAYLAWKLLHSRADLLSRDLVEENFDFYGRTLRGARELRPRWKRCADYTDDALGEILGRRFVEREFDPAAKASALEMTHGIEKAFRRDIDGLDWMSAPTRKHAARKLAAIENKIGYPEKWRDYSGLKVRRGDWFGNHVRAWTFEMRRELAKIGKPVDHGEWYMSPPTVNAYYDPTMNTINFPAGILQPPFFDAELDPAVNYGAIGGVIAHELTHGFDDQGRKFDGKGNLSDWWTPADAGSFKEKSACFVREYSAFSAGGLNLNGELTLGENTADNGGLRIALMALNDPSLKRPAERLDGFTQEQRLFLAYAQVWCSNYTDAALRQQVLGDPHSPARYRVNGVMVNMPEFSEAFACREGQEMFSADPCRVW